MHPVLAEPPPQLQALVVKLWFHPEVEQQGGSQPHSAAAGRGDEAGSQAASTAAAQGEGQDDGQQQPAPRTAARGARRHPEPELAHQVHDSSPVHPRPVSSRETRASACSDAHDREAYIYICICICTYTCVYIYICTPCKSKTIQRIVFMGSEREFPLLHSGKIYSLDFLGIHRYTLILAICILTQPTCSSDPYLLQEGSTLTWQSHGTPGC